tara:strand:+ start:475 stop:612 length:138 start_codon:yes stop_codon:yes gene_type:complete
MNDVCKRAVALREAAIKAQDPEFKKLWASKLEQLIAKAGGKKCLH